MNLGASPEQTANRAVWRKLAGFVLLSAGFAALGAAVPWRAKWGGEAGVEFVRQLGVRGPLAVLVLGALSPFALLPRWPLAVGCGLLYGVGWGGLLANVASTLGAWLQFLFARGALRPATERLLVRSGQSFAGLPPRKAFVLLMALRMFPLSSFVLTNLLAASFRLSTGTYVLGTFIGMLPSTLMYGAWGRMAAHPRPSSYVLGVLLFLLVGLAAWIVKGRLASNGDAVPEP